MYLFNHIHMTIFSYFKFNNSLKESHSYTIDQMLIECSFNVLPCNKEDFEHYISPIFGNCYKFNSGKNMDGKSMSKRISSMTGPKYGLHLELFVGYPNIYNFFRSSGAILFIHNSTHHPDETSEGMSLPTGFETDISIKESFYYRLAEPFSKCVTNLESLNSYDSIFYQETVRHFGRYSQKYCTQLCFHDHLIKKCDCHDKMLPYFGSIRGCLAEEIFNCTISAIAEYQNNSNMPSNCLNGCPQECEPISFERKISQSDFPTLFYADLLIRRQKKYPRYSNFSSFTDIKNTLVSVNIFYEDLGYTVIKDVPAKTLEQLVSELGGILGLCIGCSLLSLLEILQLLIELTTSLLSVKKSGSVAIK